MTDAWEEALGVEMRKLMGAAGVQERPPRPEPLQVQMRALVSAAEALRIALLAMGLDASTEFRRAQVQDTIGRIERLIAGVAA